MLRDIGLSREFPDTTEAASSISTFNAHGWEPGQRFQNRNAFSAGVMMVGEE